MKFSGGQKDDEQDSDDEWGMNIHGEWRYQYHLTLTRCVRLDICWKVLHTTKIHSMMFKSVVDAKLLAQGTPTLTYSLSGSSGVHATALLDDQLFVCRPRDRHMSVYSTTTFRLQRQLTITGLGSFVCGLATCASNNVLYVSDYGNHCVHRVDLSTTNVNNVIKWNVASTPAGLSVNRARNVLVTCDDEQIVQEYTPSGSLVRVISDSNYLWHAVELSSGMLAVSQWGPIHGIATVSMDGHVIHSYGNESRGSGVGQMNEPRSIAVNKDGYILVADRDNHRILIVNPMMTDSRQLPLPVNTYSRYPFTLSLDQSRGWLVVGELGDQNRVTTTSPMLEHSLIDDDSVIISCIMLHNERNNTVV